MELPKVSVQPGQFHFARDPSVLSTILGSCVGVTLWSRRLGAGALCHGVLPKFPPGVATAEGFRYVDFSIRYLAAQFDSIGASRQEVEVKLFGGADVLTVPASRSGRLTVGALNCRTALEVLEQEGFCVSASDLGGVRGRTIHFDTLTGEVLVYRLPALDSSEVRARRRRSLPTDCKSPL